MPSPIKAGDRIPFATLMTPGPDGPVEITTDAVFHGRKVVLFATPGAFTPTCSARHLPGFVQHAAELKAKGVDAVVCLAVNDVFVLSAWARDQGVSDEVQMLADGSAQFTKAIGLEVDLTARGLGIRSQRFALVATNGIVDYLAVEKPGEFAVSRAEAVLEHL